MAMAKLTEVGSNTTKAAAALVAWTCGGRGGGGTAGVILRLVLAVSIVPTGPASAVFDLQMDGNGKA